MTPKHHGAFDRILVERIINYGVVPILLIISLMLPPASLGQRLFGREGAAVSAAQGGVVSGPGGGQLMVPAGAVSRKTRLAYTAFQSGDPATMGGSHVYAASVGVTDAVTVKDDSAEGQAIAQLPQDVVTYEPLYSVSVLGKEAPTMATVTVPLPTELAAVEKADLYIWNGDAWQWQPSHASEDLLYLVTELTEFPALLAVAEAQPAPLDIAVSVDDPEEAEKAEDITTISVPGFTIDGDLGIPGSAEPVEADLCLALVSNNVDGVVRTDLTDNMLADADLRSAHVAAIVSAVTEAGFDGVDLDYAGVDPSLRGEFTALVQELADRLHQKGMQLVVRVDAPATDGVHWDTGAYDWQAIGMAADRVAIPAPTDPTTYVAGGDMDLMLAWAVGEIDRRKIELLASASARDVSPSGETELDYAEAAAILASGITTTDPTDLVQPGESIHFSAAEGSVQELTLDADAQVYSFDYTDQDGVSHTVYLETASSVARKLQYATRYALGGLAVDGALSPSANHGILTVIESANEGAVEVTAPQFAIVWSITDPDGNVGKEIVPLADPSWTWTAPNNPGGYIIGIALSDDGGQTETEPVTELDITVPTPMPEPTATPGPTVEPGKQAAFAAKFVEDVTVPDNTHFEKGEAFTKTWRLQNAGSVAWPKDTALVFDSGQNLAATSTIEVGAVEPGEQVDISVDMTTPDKDAVIKSVWRLQSAAGSFRGGSMYVQIRAGEPPVAAASTGPVVGAGQVGGYFGYGIQAHLDGNIEQILSSINGLGFGWVKQQVEWFRYNPAPGQYDWGHLDQIVDAANAHGVNVLFSVVKAPSWARPAGDTDQGPPSDPATYATFMREMAARYKGRVKAYEIWNEQNLYYEWGGRGGKLNAGKYVELLAAAYNAIKSVDPGAVVVSGALTPTGLTDWDIAVDDATYLEEMYKAGLAKYCDAIGAHPSGYNNPPDAVWSSWSDPSAPNFKGHRSFFFRSTLEQYRNIMVKYGDGGKRIWVTEFGWASTENLGAGPAAGYGYAADNTEAEQAEFIVRAYQMGRNWGWVGPMFLWNLNFAPVAGNTDEKAAFGIVRGDWSPRPAYSALQNMAK
ncbi:MAG: NBR1-Ig-like domain-containing protein [Anaerolineales bacterium]